MSAKPAKPVLLDPAVEPTIDPAAAAAAPATISAPQSIAKPKGLGLDKFKSTRAAAMANVETLVTALPIHSIAGAKDFVRLHPDEENYWSEDLCFVNVPIKGEKRDALHLIEGSWR
jgi:hypothetical protein